jgi:hypothetical protein
MKESAVLLKGRGDRAGQQPPQFFETKLAGGARDATCLTAL